MEARLGADFGGVRVHTDAVAARSAAAVGARAYTLGSDVVFGSGQFAPGSGAGRRLLAHELVHVAQHSAGSGSGRLGTAGAGSAEVGGADSEFEREADHLAASAMAANPAIGALADGAVTVGSGPSTARRNVLRRQPAAPAPAACSASQLRTTAPALAAAQRWSRLANQALSQFVAGAGGAGAGGAAAAGAAGGAAAGPTTVQVSQALTDHFKTTDAATARYVLGVLGQITAKIEALNSVIGAPAAGAPAAGAPAAGAHAGGATVSVECHTEEADTSCKTASAHVRGQLMVLCPNFLESSDQEWQSMVLVHEIAHSIHPAQGMDIIDRGYQAHRRYKDLTRDEALTNAESYALFVEQLALGKPIRSTAPTDSLHDCPPDWKPLVAKAAEEAQYWNRNALSAINNRRPRWIADRQSAYDRFLGGHTAAILDSTAEAYKKTDDAFRSDVDFECEPKGGGRCDKGAETYWYSIFSNLHICPVWRRDPNPDNQTEGILAGMYGFEGDVDDGGKRRKLAGLARELTMTLKAVPKQEDVAAALNPPPPAPAQPRP